MASPEEGTDPSTDVPTVVATPQRAEADVAESGVGIKTTASGLPGKEPSRRFRAPSQSGSSPSALPLPKSGPRGLTIGETAVQAMHDEEATRARGFGRSIALLAVLGSCAQPFFRGQTPSWLHWTMQTNLAVMGLMGFWVYRVTADPKRYTRRLYRTFAIVGVFGSIVVEYYTGIYSPAPLLVTLGIAFFALSSDDRFAIGLSASASFAYFILALGGAFGLIPDLGLFHDVAASTPARLFMAVVVPAVFLITLWQARLSRRATLEALQRSNDAVRLVRQREAQLDEANQQVDLALRAGAGQEGLYSGRMAGRYVLAEVVGRGAMGEVYAASHVDTGDRAAVKLLQAAVRDNQELLRRFLREGEVTARLRVANVVKVFEVGEMAGWTPYIAMELLTGHDLSHLLRQKRQLDLREVVELVEHVCAGLAAAHDSEVVHRDLKPQNLFLADQGAGKRPIWKILDFGVSKLRGSSGTLTHDGIVGTPGYMAPEQAQGKECDHRADIFSLGAVTYRTLTGRPPFRGADTPAILFDIVYRVPSRPSEIVTSIPSDVETVLAIALAKNPDDRFDSAAAFADAMRAASRGRLADGVRRRGVELILTHPWGQALNVGGGARA